MDPYLEEHWRDVHHSFLTYARDDLQAQLPGDLRARLEERVYVEPEFGPSRGIYPDVHVVEHPGRGGAVAVAEDVQLAEPLIIPLESEPITEGYIEIIDVGSGNRVVTAIELLSDANKSTGEGRELYRKKQRECVQAGVSLVEIDLLRSGQRVLAVPEIRVPPSHRTTYQVCVTRCWPSKSFEVYRAPLREPLPTIRVPLRQSDPDVVLQLQSLIDRCYHNGRYDDIDYRADPNPPLPPEDASWTAELLTAKALRVSTR
jgi:hypothetical protein